MTQPIYEPTGMQAFLALTGLNKLKETHNLTEREIALVLFGLMLQKPPEDGFIKVLEAYLFSNTTGDESKGAKP